MSSPDEQPRRRRPARDDQPPARRPRPRQEQDMPETELPPIQDGFSRRFYRDGSFEDTPVEIAEPKGPKRSDRIKEDVKNRAKRLNSPVLMSYVAIFFGGIVSMYALMSLVRVTFTSLTGEIFQLILAGAGPTLIAYGIFRLLRLNAKTTAEEYQDDDTADLLQKIIDAINSHRSTSRMTNQLLNVISDKAQVYTPPTGQPINPGINRTGGYASVAPSDTAGVNPFAPQAPQNQGNPQVQQPMQPTGSHPLPQRQPVQPQAPQHTSSTRLPSNQDDRTGSRPLLRPSAPPAQQPLRTNDGRTYIPQD